MSSGNRDDNDRNRLFTNAAWDGSRSPGFQKFKRDFKTGAQAFFLNDDDHSIWSACIDADQGGNAVGSEAMPGQQQAGYTNAARSRKKRQAKAFSVVYVHNDDERIREMLNDIPDNDDRRGANASIPSACGRCG